MNRLVHLAEFEKVLANYTISVDSKKILKKTELSILIAPSSGGRNTIIRELQKTGDYHFIVSDTTRKPRINDGELEQSGEHYWFRTEEEFLNDLKKGKFLEAEIIHSQQVSGISIKELKVARDEGKVAIIDVDIGGVYNIVNAKSDTKVILVLPPSYEEWQRRLIGRGTMAVDEHRRRMQTALTIYKSALEHEYFIGVINDNYRHAAEQIHFISKTGQIDKTLQAAAKKLTKELLDRTQDYFGIKDK